MVGELKWVDHTRGVRFTVPITARNADVASSVLRVSGVLREMRVTMANKSAGLLIIAPFMVLDKPLKMWTEI